MRDNNGQLIKKSSNFFRRFKKRNVVRKVVVYAMILVFLHSNFATKLIEKSRTHMILLKISLERVQDRVSGCFTNFMYFISHDIDGVLMDLHNENLKLRQEICNLKKLKSENEQLRRLLSIKQTVAGSLIVAKVVTVFSNDFARSAILNVGTLDGVSQDDVVRDNNGLIGRVIETNDTWSKVLLITDSNSNIPVKIKNVNAIANGDNSSKLLLSAIQEDDISIKDGDLVETSGYGGIFDEKIPVGTVLEKTGKLFVDPFVDFYSLKYVFVFKKQ
ncbi:MAG: rod shape-determining protein MreC [Holosporaceae bacterium]|jgi:rod shape-determining protein MreC|nr:rod shape-determining protein MreC [Holosporaceae bacterium]